MDIKDWTFGPFGTYSLCTPCVRAVSDWLGGIEINITKSLATFVLGEVKE
jgi:hypothetical protein